MPTLPTADNPATLVAVPAGQRRSRTRRRLDPLRVHGAWVYLFVAVAAGAFLESGFGVERAMLVGTGFAGGYLLMGALFTGWRRRRRQAMVGAALTILMPAAAVLWGGPMSFLWLFVAATVFSVAALAVARQQGFLAAGSVVLGTATLALAAPATALAGGAGGLQAAALFALLWPFFCWRTLRVAADVQQNARMGQRENLRRRGLREAAFTAIWGILSVVAVGWLVP